MKRIALLFAVDVDDYIAHQTSCAASSLHPCATRYNMTTAPNVGCKPAATMPLAIAERITV